MAGHHRPRRGRGPVVPGPARAAAGALAPSPLSARSPCASQQPTPRVSQRREIRLLCLVTGRFSSAGQEETAASSSGKRGESAQRAAQASDLQGCATPACPVQTQPASSSRGLGGGEENAARPGPSWSKPRTVTRQLYTLQHNCHAVA